MSRGRGDSNPPARNHAGGPTRLGYGVDPKEKDLSQASAVQVMPSYAIYTVRCMSGSSLPLFSSNGPFLHSYAVQSVVKLVLVLLHTTMSEAKPDMDQVERGSNSSSDDLAKPAQVKVSKSDKVKRHCARFWWLHLIVFAAVSLVIILPL